MKSKPEAIRIVHLISDLSIGGAETMLAKLVCGMDRRRFTNVVVSLTDRGALAHEIEAAGIRVYSLGMRRSRLNVLPVIQLSRILRTERPTFIQSWLYHADLLAFFCSRFIWRVPIVWTLRCADMDLTKYHWITRCVQRGLTRCSRSVDMVIVNSMTGRQVHERLGYRARRWELIPNGFDTQRFRSEAAARNRLLQALGLPDDSILIGKIARVDPMKDHETFLHAATMLRGARDDVQFILIGRGTERLRPEIEKPSLKGSVHILGERSDVQDLLPAMDIVCLTSLSEGFPNVLGEAMACGIPCVATDVGDARIILGGTGLVVPRRDPEALKSAFVRLIEIGRTGRRQLGIEARERVRARFDLSTVIEQYQRCYETLIAEVDVKAPESQGTGGGSTNDAKSASGTNVSGI